MFPRVIFSLNTYAHQMVSSTQVYNFSVRRRVDFRSVSNCLSKISSQLAQSSYAEWTHEQADVKPVIAHTAMSFAQIRLGERLLNKVKKGKTILQRV